MRTITTITELRRALALQREQGKRIGFVPTMGALHDGHLSLVRQSKQQLDVTVVSVFVNPTQFGPNEDFSRYPRTLDADAGLLVDEDVEFLFLPSVEEMYPPGNATRIHVGQLGSIFEGAIRPGHFDGVATVVTLLFNAVQPDTAYFGQKDLQQVAVIRQLVRDLAFPIEIKIGATIREPDGLAMSSRNRYLSVREREESLALSKTLFLVRDLIHKGASIDEAKIIGNREFQRISPSGRLDYLAVVDIETFREVTSFEREDRPEWPSAIIIAAQIGSTRLIDNVLI